MSRERGWLKAGGKQRTDATAVLAWVRSLNSRESVGENRRAALNDLAKEAPEWLAEHVDPDCFDRYVHRFEMSRFPKQAGKQLAVRTQVGEDVHHLWQDLAHQETPDALRRLPAIPRLRQVFAQHYQERQDRVHWRDGPEVRNEDRIVSPSDPQARRSRQRELVWLGYKVHLRETCDQDPQVPHLSVHVHTVPATSPESTSVEPIAEQLREQAMAPSTLFVDQGSSSATSLVEQGKHATRLLGPLHESTSWQAQARH